MIREAEERDVEAVCALLEKAFRRPNEARLFRLLQDGDDLAATLVAAGPPSDVVRAARALGVAAGGAAGTVSPPPPSSGRDDAATTGAAGAGDTPSAGEDGEDGPADAPVTGVAVLSHLVSPAGCVGLGPLAVAPEHSDRGIGKALIGACIDRAQRAGWGAIFVLGRPPYYERFGFSVEAARPFRSAYPAEFLMALELQPGALDGGGTLRYPPAFAGL